jgi:toxin-antitoxin system PIN domain toxin
MAAPRALLDVNVWVALFDDAHQFSDRANAFIEAKGTRIATCPLVENGVIRVLSLPGYGRRGGLPIHRVRQRLQEACAALDHEFWPDDISLRDDLHVDFSRVQGHNQITDLYLLALAVHRGGRLASFDQAIALSAVRQAAPRHLLLL